MMMGDDRYIWIQDVPRAFSRSREWLYQQIRAGRLHSYSSAGDKRMYLDREEITQLLAIRPAASDDPPDGKQP